MHCKAGLQFMNRQRRMELHQNLPKMRCRAAARGVQRNPSELRLFEG
jgi:hypothetical protein